MSWLLAVTVAAVALGRSITIQGTIHGGYMVHVAGYVEHHDKVLALAARKAYHAMQNEVTAATKALTNLESLAPFEPERERIGEELHEC